MSSATLTSLAMLKVNVDQGRDYLDYLRPFILQVLYDKKPTPVTDVVVKDHILNDFGLEIPERAVQIVLKRLSRQHPLKLEHGVYRITGELPNPGIAKEKANADRHIRAIIAGLKEFSKNSVRPISSDEEAVEAVCAFLAEFNIPCLRAYLRGTAIPTIDEHDNALIVLVSKYVLSLQETDPKRFESFLVIVNGHMLANALLCPDLQTAPKTYKGVTFYLDTPLLIRRLGLEGRAKQAAVENLIVLLHNLGAIVATFSHSRDELERVIYGASDYINSQNGRGAIVMEARKVGTNKSDLLLFASRINVKLADAGIKVLQTPSYKEKFQIDEDAFEGVLKDEVSYHNPRAKEDDINSVRSIYVLRSGISPRNLEHAKAVLVTSNSGFAHAAFEYGKDHEESREVSSVITDFSLANMAWLKAPLSAPTIPMTEVIAFSYAALQPSKGLLDKYLGEIDKLENQGDLTERDHQLLRSSALAQQELMDLTLGEENALIDQTVRETLDRVENEIKREENEKYKEEKEKREKANEQFEKEKEKVASMQAKIYWRCRRKANIYAWTISTFVGLLLLFGLAAGHGLKSSNLMIGRILFFTFLFLAFLTLANLITGTTVVKLHGWVRSRYFTRFLRRELDFFGLDLERYNELP